MNDKTPGETPYNKTMPAPKGNKNAKRKSLYEKLFTVRQRRALKLSQPTDLSDEIDLQRILTYLLVENQLTATTTPEELQTLLQVISISNVRLASLLKTRLLIKLQKGGIDNEFDLWIEEMLTDAQKFYGIRDNEGNLTEKWNR